MIFSENRSPLFGIMRCRHHPGRYGRDHYVRHQRGAGRPRAGRRLCVVSRMEKPLAPAIFAHFMVSRGLTRLPCTVRLAVIAGLDPAVSTDARLRQPRTGSPSAALSRRPIEMRWSDSFPGDDFRVRQRSRPIITREVPECGGDQAEVSVTAHSAIRASKFRCRPHGCRHKPRRRPSYRHRHHRGPSQCRCRTCRIPQ